MLRLTIFLVIIAAISSAQTYTGSIAGRVTDPSGAVIPKTQVTVTDVATGSVVKTETNEAGDYVASFLGPGSYSIGFTAHGFKELVFENVTMRIHQQLRVNATLQVGISSENVSVSGAVDQVNYSSPEIGHSVTAEQLVNLPLVATPSRGRSPLLLAKLLPGVTSTSSSNSNINNFSFGGGRPNTNEILIDGLPTTNPSDNTYTLTPSPDSLQEFRVVTSPFSAEWGHTGGGVMILTTKSGTNELHGTAYDLFRNRLLNARSYFDSTNKTKYVQNDAGGTLGGPVVIPKLYNGKNKTFFFVDFNETLSSTGNVYSQLVPTSLEKQGDFSQTVDSSGNLVKIYDPATVVKNPDGTFSRSAFAGNVIPVSRIDPVAAQIVKFYPNPNGVFAGDNYQVHPPKEQQILQSIVRVDHNFSDSDHMFVRFGRYSPNADATQQIDNIANNTTSGGWHDTQVALSETHVFTPSLFSDFRVGFVQEKNYDIAGGGSAAVLGLKGVSLNEFPIISTDQYIKLGSNASDHDRDRSWVFSEALNSQVGRHTIKFGGDFRRQMYNYYDPGKLAGQYSFDTSFTDNPIDGSGGNSLASLLLGAPSQTQIQFEDYTYRLNINSAAAFIQDDFKITPHLTINMGLRWEFAGPYSEANNQFASFNPAIVNSQTGTLGDVQFAGINGAPSHFSPNIYHDFLPRIGFAWNFGPHTVLRGGYGLYRYPSTGFAGYGSVSKYQVNATFQSKDGGITPAYLLRDGVPAYSYNVDANGLPMIPASLTDPTSSVVELDPRTRTPYTQNFQIGIQTQLGSQWLFEVDYAGNKGTKLPIITNLNQIPSGEWRPGETQSLRPFPQYTDVEGLFYDGNSTYHSLQVNLERRWKSGFLLSVAYTFSKLIDDVDPTSYTNTGNWTQDAYNLKAERGIGAYDVPQRFVVNSVYDLPVGRGGRYLTSVPVLKDVIGGWELAGLTEIQSGLPLHINQPNLTNGYSFVQRANQVSPVRTDSGNLQQWFSTNSFVEAPAYTLGNAARYPFHGPGVVNTDLSLMRNLHFGERVTAQFRGEFYNAFNHANFSAPNTTINSQNYGRITSAQAGRVTEVALRFFF
jgi:hypothetical protein